MRLPVCVRIDAGAKVFVAAIWIIPPPVPRKRNTRRPDALPPLASDVVLHRATHGPSECAGPGGVVCALFFGEEPLGACLHAPFFGIVGLVRYDDVQEWCVKSRTLRLADKLAS